MKKLMKSLALLLALAFVLTGFAGCSGTDVSVAAIQKRGELVMLTNAAFPPFEYVEDGKEVGVDIDIANEIAKDLGVTLKVVNMDFDPIVDYIKSGKGDIGAAGMTITDERKESVDFSIEYVKSKQYIITLKDNTDIKPDNLDGLTIGVQTGTTGDTIYASDEDVIKAKEVKRYKSVLEAASDLKLGRLDCIIIDELPAKKVVEQNPEFKCEESVWEEEWYAIAVQKGNTTLLDAVNKTLQRLLDEGKIDEYIVNHS